MENKYEITIDYYKFIQTGGWVVDVKSNKMLRYMSTSKRMRDPSIKKKKSSSGISEIVEVWLRNCWNAVAISCFLIEKHKPSKIGQHKIHTVGQNMPKLLRILFRTLGCGCTFCGWVTLCSVVHRAV